MDDVLEKVVQEGCEAEDKKNKDDDNSLENKVEMMETYDPFNDSDTQIIMTAKDTHRSSTSKPSKKRLRVQTSADEYLPDSDEELEVGASASSKPGRSDGAKPRGHPKAKVSEMELKIEKLKKDCAELKKTNEKLVKEKEDNFRELAETQLQCAVCREPYVEATSINCGHTYCNYCISEWMKNKTNCPVCRTDIKQTVKCKVLDEYLDQVYDMFVGEGGKIQRQTFKEERSKIKEDNEAANAARAQVHTNNVIIHELSMISLLSSGKT